MQPSFTVVKGKKTFATVTHGRKDVIFMKICDLLKKKKGSPKYPAKKRKFHFSFFKVDSQNPY